MEASDRQSPLTLECIAGETRKAYGKICETEAILARLSTFYIAFKRLSSEDRPRRMTVSLDHCLADGEAMAAKLFNRRLLRHTWLRSPCDYDLVDREPESVNALDTKPSRRIFGIV